MALSAGRECTASGHGYRFPCGPRARWRFKYLSVERPGAEALPYNP